MGRCRAEFTVEPFIEGDPGPHVAAAIAAAEAAGLTPDVGPFGTSIEGDVETVLGAVRRVIDDGIDSGATRVSIQLTALAD